MPARLLRIGFLALIIGGCSSLSTGIKQESEHSKPRVIVTTDPELDDSNSLLRYLLYSADFETEGLIYASSGVHWKGDGKGTMRADPPPEAARRGLNPCPCTSWRWTEGERFIDDAVALYAQSYANLRTHDSGYPSPGNLRSRIHWGNVEFPGDISTDSPGSDLIKSLLLDDRPGPLYLLAWGGQSTIGRALKSIQEQYASTPAWPALRDRISGKAIIQAFGDQDDVYSSYIKPNWPGIEFRQMATRTYGYGARTAVLPEDQVYLSAVWTRTNISSRGPMGEHYRVWGDGKQMVKDDIFDHFGFSGLTDDQLKARGYIVWTPVQEKGSWISEGDTSTFMNLIDNGLRSHEQASYGGWGGRNGQDIGRGGPDDHHASARFFGAAQRDLASRFQWAETPRFRDANHPPRPSLDGSVDRRARAGDKVELRSRVEDPDQDQVTLRWWQYSEADTFSDEVLIQGSDSPVATVQIPGSAKSGDTVHVILEVTDSGIPKLTRYQRVVIHVE